MVDDTGGRGVVSFDGLLGWGHPMLMRVCRRGIISRAVMKRAASSDSAAEAITNLMIWAIERTAPLNLGKGTFSERGATASLCFIEKACIRVST